LTADDVNDKDLLKLIFSNVPWWHPGDFTYHTNEQRNETKEYQYTWQLLQGTDKNVSALANMLWKISMK